MRGPLPASTTPEIELPSSPPDGEAAGRMRGIALYCLSLFLFACLDTSAKYAGRYVPSMEVAWVRFIIHFVLAIVILRPWRAIASYRTGRPGLQTLRSLFLVGSTVGNFLALRELQLDQTVSIGFSSPFLIAALAGPILGEWAGPRRWIAILIGFVGVIVVTAPGQQAFNPAILFSVGAAVSYAFYILLTRLLSTTETSASMLLYSAVLPTLMLTPFAAPVSVAPPNALVLFCLLMTGVCGILGHWFVIRSHTVAPAPVLAPFMYTELIWMIALGYFVFGDVPTPRTLAGAAIIVASGLYLLYRERVRRGA